LKANCVWLHVPCGDLNFDGYLDFSVVTEFAGTTGDGRSYWVYDPISGIFVQNEFTQVLRCGSAAVTSKNGGTCRVAALIDFDPEKHEIGRRYFGGAMGAVQIRVREKENVTAS
jgi:hypothetical protein